MSEVEQFEFLEDVIPHTMTLKAALERRKDTLDEGGSLEPSRKKAKGEQAEEPQQEDAMAVDSNGVRQEDEAVQPEEQQQTSEQADHEQDQETSSA